MRGLFLPPGRYTIIYYHEPKALWCGALISVFSWCACGVLLLQRRAKRGVLRRSGRNSNTCSAGPMDRVS
jgi:hypothetical protein